MLQLENLQYVKLDKLQKEELAEKEKRIQELVRKVDGYKKSIPWIVE